ncbi:MAG: hypothetical protein DWP95_01470 [Proteobacteria bacterium]|nr:MAG: hypothetical protein DWP95_01470 [Pseudomonadota bacterium]
MNKIGMWSTLGMFVVGILYVITMAIGMYSVGLTKPIVDPILGIMEVLTLITAPLLVISMSAIHRIAPEDQKTYSLIALAFAIMVASLTGAVHFVGLTVLRQTGTEGIVWPSIIYGVELLAWDIFLGLSLLFAAQVFQGSGLKRNIRIALIITGALCLIGSLGPITGDMRLQFVSVLSYGILLPFVWLMIARYFQQFEEMIRAKTS